MGDKALTDNQNKVLGKVYLKLFGPRLIMEMLNFYKEEYVRNNNALFAWQAYKLARDNDITVPEWVTVYFDNAADSLLSIEAPGNKASLEIVRALHLQPPKGEKGKSGRGNIFTQFKIQLHRMKAVSFVEKKLNEKPDYSVEKACLEALEESGGEFGNPDSDTLKKWYSLYKRAN